METNTKLSQDMYEQTQTYLLHKDKEGNQES